MIPSGPGPRPRHQVELVPGGSCPPGPVGMLTVRLIRIQGLQSEDLIGHFDPYVMIQAGAVVCPRAAGST